MLNRFRSARRSAVAIMFALSLLPLVLLVGLAIDTAFYSQVRTQVGLAAEAAATHAVRVAAGAYTLDIANNQSVATATSDAISQGNTAGALWFSAQLGPLLKGATATLATTNGVNVISNNTVTGDAAGFTGTVTYNLSYPPIFGDLFGFNSNFTTSASATAQTEYKYVEVLLLIDTSNSMLLGARQSDINTMALDSACPQTSSSNTSLDYLTNSLGLEPLQSSGSPTGYTYESNSLDGNSIDFTAVPYYYNPSGATTDDSGYCLSGHQPATEASLASVYPANPSAGAPLDTCSLACHTTTSKASDGYYQDLYGMARREQVELRLDVVIQATEAVIEKLYSEEQSQNQFTVGIYQFNTDVSAIVAGQTGDANVEATANLEGTSTSALQTIETNYDYNYNKSETGFPAITTYAQTQTGNTDFPDSVTDLINGNATGGTKLGAVNTATAGSTNTNPEKNIFIITDGFEDYGPNINSRLMGEMTSYLGEEAGSSTAVCQKFKSLGFSVYVLYVVYDPVPNFTFYTAGDASFYSTTDNTDFSNLKAGKNAQENVLAGAPSGLSVAEVMGSNPDNGADLGVGEVGPDTEALEACASPGDFYEASSDTDITAAMKAMLASAISSSITVTH